MNKLLAGTLVLLIGHAQIAAQQKGTAIGIANLGKLWQMALTNNSNQKVYQLKIAQAMADDKAAHGFLYPQASGSFAGQDNLKLSTTPVPGALIGQPGKTVYLQFGKNFTYASGITISKTLFDWQNSLQAKIAKENVALTTAQDLANGQSLKTQIGQYYYSLLIANASLAISERDLAVADSVLQITKQKLQQGLIDMTALNSAAINLNNVQQNIYQSKELKKQAIANIKILAGLTNNDSLLVEESLSTASFTDKNIPALGEDKNLLVYPHSLTISQLQVKTQKSLFLPKFSTVGYFGYQQFRDDLSMSFGNGAWKDYQYIGLNMSVPIFTGFTNSNKLKSTTVQQHITEEQFKSAVEQSKINDAALLESYNNYFDLTATAKQTFLLYGANLALYQQKYQEGLISIDTYFKNFEDYLHAENTYLTNLSNLLSVQVTILARQ